MLNNTTQVQKQIARILANIVKTRGKINQK